MKAMIFAAGIGSRLRPLTDTMPKALVEVGGKPALARVLDRLTAAGVDSFVINIHHFPEQIRSYVKSHYGNLDVAFSDESARLLDTGGALLAAKPMLESEPCFIVHNADIVTDASIAEMLRQHRESKADVTLLVGDRRSSRCLMFDAADRLRGWQNIATGDRLPEGADFEGCSRKSFGGVHIINSDVLCRLEEFAGGRNVFSIIPFYASSASQLDIRSFTPRTSFYWHDIGTPDRLDAANKLFINQPSTHTLF